MSDYKYKFILFEKLSLYEVWMLLKLRTNWSIFVGYPSIDNKKLSVVKQANQKPVS